MRVPGRKAVVRSARWLRSRPVRRALILGYHRIEDATDDVYGLSVSPGRFAEQMEMLARLARPVRLRDLVTNSLSPLRSDSVVVTFDDGYADLIDVALPVLEHYRIPATVFVVSGYLGREFWWDQLARLTSADSVGSGIGDGADQHRVTLHAAGLRALPDSDRQRSLATLARDVRLSDPAVRALSEDEIRRMARRGLVEIGAHTVTHPVLPLLSEGEQRCELEDSRRALEAVAGRPIFSFAYPHGALSEKTVRLVRQAGYTAACCSTPDVVSHRSDLLRLPRFWVGNWGAERFERFLRRWLLD
jgi:peptidoglycan/xylan/chitin deacetylase (PgdA/CDA1 family)